MPRTSRSRSPGRSRARRGPQAAAAAAAAAAGAEVDAPSALHRTPHTEKEAEAAEDEEVVKADANAEGSGTRSTIVTAVLVALACSAFIVWAFFDSILLQSLHSHVIILVVGGFLSFLFIAAVALAWFFGGFCMRPPWYRPSSVEQGLDMRLLPEYWQGVVRDPKTDLGLDYVDVEFASPTAVGGKDHMLRGWHVPVESELGTIIVMVHGGGRDRRAFLRHVPLFHRNDYACLLFDLSEHGVSDGTRRGFSYGVREHKDVIAAAQFAKKTLGYKRIVVLSTSVGGTAGIIATALCKDIDACIAENALTRPEELIEDIYWLGLDFAVGRRLARNAVLRTFGRLVMAVFLYRVGAINGDSLWSTHVSAIDVIHRISPRPVLLMHGTADQMVSHAHSERLFENAAEPKKLWISSGATHCALFDHEPAVFEEHVLTFLAQVK